MRELELAPGAHGVARCFLGGRGARRMESFTNPLDEEPEEDKEIPPFDSERDGDTAGGEDGPPSGGLRRKVFLTLDEPDYSILSRVISTTIMLMIFASSTSFVMETTSGIRSNDDLLDQLHLLENICIIAFTLEYVVRVLCCTERDEEPDPPSELAAVEEPEEPDQPVRARDRFLRTETGLLTSARARPQAGKPGVVSYILKPMNLIDLFAVLPFWLEMILGGTLSAGFLRMLRMTRIFRVLKIGSFADELVRAPAAH